MFSEIDFEEETYVLFARSILVFFEIQLKFLSKIDFKNIFIKNTFSSYLKGFFEMDPK